MDEEPAVQTMDCTPLMEALVEKETKLDTVARRKREGFGVAEGDAQIQGVQRSEKQQARSTEELSNRLIEKENRRAEDSAGWSNMRVD